MPHNKFGKIAVCLAGGGARGLCQAGMIQAWNDFGIQHDVLYGASVGALNGVLLQQKQMTEMINLWLRIKNSDVFTWNPFMNVLSPFNGNSCLFDSTPLFKLIQKLVNPALLFDNQTPFYINTTDLKAWAPLSIEIRDIPTTELHTYLRASASPPILFPAVPFKGTNISSTADDTVLVDGGILNNFSVLDAVRHGADTIVVMSPTTPEPKVPNNLADMLGILTSLPEYEFLNREIAFVNKINEIEALVPTLKKIKILKIQPPEPIGIGLIDFSYAGKDRRKLIEYGYTLAMNVLKTELA